MKEKPETQASVKEETVAKRRYLILSDTCVCCGEPVPKGRQICWRFEHQYDSDENLF